jgi:carboxypeptidase PM20D1
MKKILFVLLIPVVSLLAVLGVKTKLCIDRWKSEKGIRLIPHPDTLAALHLQQAVGIPTVSFDDAPDASREELDSLNFFLRQTYPVVFSTLVNEPVEGQSLLLKWIGNSNTSMQPILLYAHMDVVPVEEKSDSSWRFTAFPKHVQDDTLRGRGTIDDKLGVIGILEAVNRLVAKGFRPNRDIYLAFGSDEETGGTNGAAKIAAALERKGIQLEWMLDEGGMVAEKMVPFVEAPVALIMTAEKGYMTMDLTVTGPGGHSSFPPKETPIDILAAAIMKLKSEPFERKICSPVDDFMDHAGAEMKFPFNVLFANRWLFSSLLLNEYSKIPEGDAMIRTTSAFTKISGGVKENTMPTTATVTVNFRILPGEDSRQTLEKVKRLIHDDRVSLHVHPDLQEPSPVASLAENGFAGISQAIRKVFPDAVIVPGLSIGATDSRHFGKVAKNRYRFLPVRMNREILSGMHGSNERIPMNCFMESIRFYEVLLNSN